MTQTHWRPPRWTDTISDPPEIVKRTHKVVAPQVRKTRPSHQENPLSHPPADGHQAPQYQATQNPQGQPYPPQQPPKKKGGLLKWGLGCLGLIILVIALAVACTAIAANSGKDTPAPSSEQSASTGAGGAVDNAESPAPVEAKGAVLLDATGTGSATYGPLGTGSTADVAGSWSKEITAPADDEVYSLTIQDTTGAADASVSCKITVDGEVVDEQEASGAYSLATCTQPLF